MKRKGGYLPTEFCRKFSIVRLATFKKESIFQESSLLEQICNYQMSSVQKLR